MSRFKVQAIKDAPQIGIAGVILLLSLLLTIFAGSAERNGQTVNLFLNPNTLFQTACDASFFALMTVGMTLVIISGGIDLSVGSTYALCGVITAKLLHSQSWMMGSEPSAPQAIVGGGLCLALGLACGLINGILVAALKVHPFIITLGTMWVFRGIAFVVSKGLSITFPEGLTGIFKASLGLEKGLYAVPILLMLLVVVSGSILFGKTVFGRRAYAIGGNADAARYAGLPIQRTLIGIYGLNGLLAGLAAFAGCSFYGAASSADATGYELFVIASAVVGGASLLGGKGTALGAMLGAILIVLIRQSIRILHFDQNYESIIIGVAVVAAVVLDQASQGWRRRTVA
jgi:ribose transport system permease protein